MATFGTAQISKTATFVTCTSRKSMTPCGETTSANTWTRGLLTSHRLPPYTCTSPSLSVLAPSMAPMACLPMLPQWLLQIPTRTWLLLLPLALSSALAPSSLPPSLLRRCNRCSPAFWCLFPPSPNPKLPMLVRVSSPFSMFVHASFPLLFVLLPARFPLTFPPAPGRLELSRPGQGPVCRPSRCLQQVPRHYEGL